MSNPVFNCGQLQACPNCNSTEVELQDVEVKGRPVLAWVCDVCGEVTPLE